MNTFYDYLHYMQEGGMPQQQAPQQGGGDQQQQIMQIIQMYAEITQTDPRQIMQQLQQMQPDQQQQALEQMVQAVQQAMAQQQGGGGQEEQMAQQPAMRSGGSFNPGPGTYNPGMNTYFGAGGAFIPTYGEYAYAYGGPHSEIPSLFNQPVDRPNKAMYGMGMAQGGQKMPQWLAERRFTAAGNRDQMSDYGYEEGGIVVGQEMNATPEMIQKLKDGGYTFEYID